MMQTTAVADWHFTPPGLGPGLKRARPRSPAPESLADQIVRECVSPAVQAASAAVFLEEVRRRLPLFAVLRTQYLERLVAEVGAEGLQALVHEASVGIGRDVRRWAENLDETSRAELEFAVAKLGRSNEAILSALQSREVVNEAHVPDLFRTAVVLDFLVFCLFDLATREVWPQIAAQVVNSLRYATLDYAAAVRRAATLQGGEATVVDGDVDEEIGVEDTFWASVARLSVVQTWDP